MSTIFSIGQMNQHGDALEAAGYTPEEVTKMKPFLKDFRKVLLGQAQISVVKHVIDMDVIPFIPNGLRIEEKDQLPNRVRGQLEFDPTSLELYLAQEQKKSCIGGHYLRKDLENQPKLVHGANLLDFLLIKENWGLIPESWRGKWIFFWGTIYRASDDDLYVRCLYVRGDGSCYSRYRWIGHGFYSLDPAAVAGK